MSLSKKQIVFIDDYLKRKRLKYWDIRLEMVDHLASKLENNKDLVLNEALLKNEFGDLFQIKKREQLISIAIGKKYRKMVFNEAKILLNKFIGLILFFLFYVLEYFIFKYFDYKIFIKINLTIIFLSLLPTIIYTIKNLIQKNKSKHLELAANYAIKTFSFFNFPIIMMGIYLRDGESIFAVKNLLLVIFLICFVPIHLLFTFCGTKIYLKILKEYTSLFNEQQKLNAAH